jgi:hypothetical protein
MWAFKKPESYFFLLLLLLLVDFLRDLQWGTHFTEQDTITTVNGARVLTTDLRLGKLLVHVVDRVLMPGNFPSQTILEILNDGGRFQSTYLP